MCSTDEYQQQQYWKNYIELGEGLWRKIDREYDDSKSTKITLTQEVLNDFFNPKKQDK